ncbi:MULTISPECIES: hypothetical protein [unclassified Mycoplasma]|uniref:hypothetical protein n=1 Tax=unclassified Mycoplasma TaxID=2683645 RepID=UPI00211BC750|nr:MULTISPECIES: hypothetical protein [unclassified Mycoplasma]UUM20102.1 hypothetical protein NPA11_01595 [Mycoplasma sp. 1578d]UUM25082.1 hypothetical protein NPA12_01570 [Mycoplasma sp. 3686d]
MLKNKNIKKAFVLVPTTAATLAIGLGATLSLIHSKEAVNTSTVYGNFLQGENLFKLYSPYFQGFDQHDQVLNIYRSAKADWQSKDKKLQDKLVSLDKAQAAAFDFYINHINQIPFKDQEALIFWNKVLTNQEDRIRELDLKDQLTQLKDDQSIKFLDDLFTANEAQKKEYLKNLSQGISKLVVVQNNDLMPYIQLLETTANKIDNLPFQGLKKDVTSSLTPLYSRIISANIRLNEIQIASQDTKNELDKLKQVLDDSQTEINEINEYLKQIEPYVHNTAYSASEQANVQKFLDSTKINLDIALNKADINQIHNSVVTFYQQISDTQKTTTEIKQVIKDLTTYVNAFDPILRFNQEMVNSLIDQTLLINNKKELISAKSNLFSVFYALKFSNQLITELKSKIKSALDNNIITQKRSTILNSQIDAIVNQHLSAQELANQIFAFYNVEDKELETLTYLNNELKLIQTQISEVKRFKFTSKDIAGQLTELNNQVIKTYSNDVTSSFLTTVKNQLNEILRNILKSDLKQLIDLLNKEIKKINNLNEPINKNIVNEAQKLNAETSIMVQDFNPIPSARLIEQIKTYDIKLQNLINADKQTQVENFSNFTDHYMKTVFSNNDDTYHPTQNEKKRIDLYDQYKKQLDDLRAQINDGNGDPKLAQDIETISGKLRNLTNTGNDFRQLSNLDKQAQQDTFEKTHGPNSLALEPYINAVNQAREEVEQLFSNPDATLEQIQNAKDSLQKALDELNHADSKILLEQKLAQLKNTIDQQYTSEPNLSGSLALLKQYNDLLLASQAPSNQAKSNEIISKANKLIELTPQLYEAEINKKRLLDIIGDKNSGKYTNDKTIDAIGRGNLEIISIDRLIDQLNNPDNIPNLASFENAKTELLERGNEILLAYEQDKINLINQAIQKTKNSNNGGANDAYAISLKKVDNYATIQKSQLNLEHAQESGEKMELFQELANVSAKLLESYNLYNNGSTVTLSDYISSVLTTNDLSVGDTNQQIKDKTNALNKAQSIILAKKEFLDVYEQLKLVLDHNKEWKIYQPLRSEINLILQQTNAIIFNNDLTVEQIQAKKAEFAALIKVYKTRKDNLLNEFNQAITSVNAKQDEFDADIATQVGHHSNYSFDHYYARAKQDYANAQTPAQKTNVDTQDIKDFAVKLEIGFLKDQALNKLKDIETSAKSAQFGSSNLHTKVKSGWTSFDNSVKNTLDIDNLTLEQVKDINNKVNRYSDLFNLEKRVADYVSKTQSRVNAPTLSIEQLKQALESTLPIASDNYDEINNKYEQLNTVYIKEAEIQEIRENIVFQLENNDITLGAQGISGNLTNALGATYDSDVTVRLRNWSDNIKTSANTSTSRDVLANLLKQVQRVRDEVPAIATLAKSVARARNILDGLNNNSSNLVSSYAQKLNAFITQAKSNYFKETVDQGKANNVDFYNDLSNKINFTNQKLTASDMLATKLDDIETIINNSDFNLRSLNGQVGLTKLQDFQNYLNSFEIAAQNDEYNQGAVDKINALITKANSFKSIIDIDRETLQYGNTLAQTNSPTATLDLESTLALVWDSLPSANQNPNSSLGKQAGNNYNVNDLFDLSSPNALNAQAYNALAEKIVTEISVQKDAIQNKNIYRKATNTKITNLEQHHFTALVHNDLRNALLGLLNSLDQENNNARTLSITPDETGELNIVRAKVETIETHLTELKNLAQKAYELSNFNNTVISNLPLITSSKNQTTQLLQKAESYYNSIDKMKLTGNDSIQSVTQELEQQQFKLRLLSTYEQVFNAYNDELSLSMPAKNVIKAKLDAFVTEYNNNTLTPNQLFDKYFRKVTELQPNEPASAKNSLIKYALDNAVNLQKAYNNAISYLALKDPSLDSVDVQSKFTQITNLINGANGVMNTLNAMNNDEQIKINLFNNINTNIEQLINNKKAQIQQQLDENNQIKTFFDSVKNNFSNNNNNAPTYVDGFEQKGITDLTNANSNKVNLSYSQVNVYLTNAKAVANLQIFDLYTKAINVVENIKNEVLQYYNDFDATKTAVRSGSQVDAMKYAPILTLKNQIDSALNANFNVVENYVSKINSLVAIINGNHNQVIEQFVNTIKMEFAQKFNPKPTTNGSTDKPGFYVKFKEKLDMLKQNVAGQNVNLFKYNQIESIENQYDAFINEFESLNQIYSSIQTKKDSGSLSSFATSLDKLNQNFIELEQNVKNAANVALNKNPLEAVFADVFENIRYSDTSKYTSDIKNTFQTFKASIVSKINNVHTEPNFNFSTLNKDSNADEDLSNLLKALTEYKDWIKQPQNKNKLLTQLDDNPNQTNNFAPIEAGLDGNFDKKYKVIITNQEYTRTKFVNNFENIVNNDPNANTTQLVEISNNDAFLAMFNQFAFTKKDVTSDTQLKSIYSPIKFKVYIKKYNTNGWFDLVAPVQPEVDRQSLRAKIVYSYESDITDIGELKIEKDVVLTFKTLDTIEILPGTSSVFINNNSQVGLNAKYEAIDVDEAGWNIPQVTSTTAPNATTVKNEVITKVYNKMKAAIFDLNNSNSTIANSTSPITPKTQYLNTLRTATDPDHVNLNYIHSGNTTRLSANIDATNRNTSTRYGFDIENQSIIPITYALSLSTNKQDERLLIIPQDSEKGFSFMQIQGGRITGTPTNGNLSGRGAPGTYDSKLNKVANGGNNIYNRSNDWWNATVFPTGFNINLYEFNIDYDPVLRKVYLYVSWLENVLYPINKVSVKSWVDKYKTKPELKQADKDFLTQLSNNFGSVPATYTPTPGELSRTFEIFALYDNILFKKQGIANWLAVSVATALGGAPIFPLTGGQNIIYRTSANDPKTATLRVAPTQDYQNIDRNTQLEKGSALVTLYSALINKFWFKIR